MNAADFEMEIHIRPFASFDAVLLNLVSTVIVEMQNAFFVLNSLLHSRLVSSVD